MVKNLSLYSKSEFPNIKNKLIEILDNIGDDFIPSPTDYGPEGAKYYFNSLTLNDFKFGDNYPNIGKNYDVILKQDKGQIVGFLSFNYFIPTNYIENISNINYKIKNLEISLEKVGHITAFYVKPSYRGRGIAKNLETKALESMAKKDKKYVVLKSFVRGDLKQKTNRFISGTNYYLKTEWEEIGFKFPNPDLNDASLYPNMPAYRANEQFSSIWFMKRLIKPISF